MITVNLKTNQELICTSDIHEHPDQFFELLDKHKPSNDLIYVFLGDLKDKGHGEDAFVKIATKIKDLVNLGQAFFLKGNHELKAIKKNRKNIDNNSIYYWIDLQPIAISFLYPNQARYTCVHAGITPKMTWDTISRDINVCYTRVLDKNGNHVHMIKNPKTESWEPSVKDVTEWHNVYDGRFGYVVSGHNYNQNNPTFYNYSCNIDSGVFNTGILSAVIFNQNGKKEVIKIIGEPYGKKILT